MKKLALVGLLVVGLIYLGGCHWQHRHHHRYAAGYYSR